MAPPSRRRAKTGRYGFGTPTLASSASYFAGTPASPAPVRFSPDGTKLASTGTESVVRVWALDLDDLLRIASENVTRGPTGRMPAILHVDTWCCP